MLITKREEVTKQGFCKILWRKLRPRGSLLLEFIQSSGWGGGGRLFEAGRLLTFSAFSMGAYSRWALIRGWAIIRINTVIFLAGKKVSEIKGFDQFTFAPPSHFLTFIGHLWAGNKSAQNLIVGESSLIPPKGEKECLANCFQSKICELVSGKLSKGIYIYTQL